MNCEIVYVCNSTNNKNVRANELSILRKNEEQLYFEFGDSENNIKKRFYNSLEKLNKDFDEIVKIKEKLENEKPEEEKTEEKIEAEAEKALENFIKEISVENESNTVETENFKKIKYKSGKKKIF